MKYMKVQDKQIKMFLCKLLIFFAVFLISCENQSTLYLKEYGTLLWINSSHSEAAIKEAVGKTLENASIITAQVSWRPEDSTHFHNASWYFSLAKDHGKSLMISVDWQENERQGTRGGWRFTDKEVQYAFNKDMIQLVKNYNPNYLNLGVEVNYYALTNPSDFKVFVHFYNDLKKSLKELAPNLKIGLSYQLELLWGVHSKWSNKKTLETLNAVVENLDFLGVSTYPDVNKNSRIDIGSSLNFLDSLSLTYNVPIGIAETGVSSSNYIESAREEYIDLLYNKASALDFSFLIWGAMLDPSLGLSWKDSIGLMTTDGQQKVELDLWIKKNNLQSQF